MTKRKVIRNIVQMKSKHGKSHVVITRISKQDFRAFQKINAPPVKRDGARGPIERT